MRSYADDTYRPFAPKVNEVPLDGLLAASPAPLSHDNPESLAAAESILPVQKSMQMQVLTYLAEHGPLSSDAIEAANDWPHQTVSARLLELSRLKLIEEAGKALTRSGRRATTWKVTEATMRVLARREER